VNMLALEFMRNAFLTGGCIALAAKFRVERPELWFEDWGGEPNPAR